MDNKEHGNKQDQHGSHNAPGEQQSGQKPSQGGEKRNDEHNRPGGSQGGGQQGSHSGGR